MNFHENAHKTVMPLEQTPHLAVVASYRRTRFMTNSRQYEALVLSTLLNGSESWPSSVRKMKRLEAAHHEGKGIDTTHQLEGNGHQWPSESSVRTKNRCHHFEPS